MNMNRHLGFGALVMLGTVLAACGGRATDSEGTSSSDPGEGTSSSNPGEGISSSNPGEGMSSSNPGEGTSDPSSSSSTSATGGGSSGGYGAGVKFACDNRARESTCFNFASEITLEEASCDGEIIMTPCPLENAVGLCTIEGQWEPNGPILTFSNVYYSDGIQPHTEAEAADTCSGFNGTFSVP